MTPTRTAVVLLGGLALVATACAGPGTAGSGQTPVDGQTFTLALGSDPGNLDPHMSVLSVTGQVDKFLYDSLTELSADGKPLPELAEKWTDTSTTAASFTLRPGLTCADGAPLTAADVAANIVFVGDPANKSPYAGLTVAPGTKATADEATRTITVTSGAPDAFLLRNIGSLPIVCGKGLADRKLLAKGESGTGLFAVSEAVPNDHYTFTRRKDYKWGPGDWKAEPGLPDKVVLRVVSNTSTAANLLLSGELNAGVIIGPDRQRLDARKLFHGDYNAPLGEIFFNQAAGRPGEDEAVRRALTQSLDLAQLGKVLTSGTGKPSQGLVTADPKACSGDTVTGNLPSHDPAAAAAALDAAGWKAGADGVRVKNGKRLTLNVIYGTQLGPTMAPTAELFQQTWKALGAEVTLKGVDSPGLSQVLFGTGEWEVSLGPLGLTLPSQLVPFVSGPAAPDGTNFGHIANPAYDQAVKQAAAANGEASCPTWNAAETALIKQVDVVPYIDSVTAVYGSGSKFTISQGAITPSSIRMYAK
ncbi:ABC transporter substrate-binding protein [Amycolatopsis sp., V23-08]|uniref:ABC transporter substrate-binding protein n=1 Tax=Amycolatopsis heterodermiae TaxID=3110235 RepID=A0ABU5R4F6_9PSEU|nr:ABC transporter substrate-binding protein [Amycolatopsis sp., V23-08]MEA5360740.1 ABC transporter substrate-binding protein [Amycolatopsis sp., V23-08]